MLNLEELSDQLRVIDQNIVSLLAERMAIALQVEEWKEAHNQPIIRPEIEDKRLIEAREWALIQGINPNFISSIFYFIIRESCAVQIEWWQK